MTRSIACKRLAPPAERRASKIFSTKTVFDSKCWNCPCFPRFEMLELPLLSSISCWLKRFRDFIEESSFYIEESSFSIEESSFSIEESSFFEPPGVRQVLAGVRDGTREVNQHVDALAQRVRGLVRQEIARDAGGGRGGTAPGRSVRRTTAPSRAARATPSGDPASVRRTVICTVGPAWDGLRRSKGPGAVGKNRRGRPASRPMPP